MEAQADSGLADKAVLVDKAADMASPEDSAGSHNAFCRLLDFFAQPCL